MIKEGQGGGERSDVLIAAVLQCRTVLLTWGGAGRGWSPASLMPFVRQESVSSRKPFKCHQGFKLPIISSGQEHYRCLPLPSNTQTHTHCDDGLNMLRDG